MCLLEVNPLHQSCSGQLLLSTVNLLDLFCYFVFIIAMSTMVMLSKYDIDNYLSNLQN